MAHRSQTHDPQVCVGRWAETFWSWRRIIGSFKVYFLEGEGQWGTWFCQILGVLQQMQCSFYSKVMVSLDFLGKWSILEKECHLCPSRQGNPRDDYDGRFISGEIVVDRCRGMLVGNIILFPPSSHHRGNDLGRKILRKKNRFLPELQVWWNSGELPLDTITWWGEITGMGQLLFNDST